MRSWCSRPAGSVCSEAGSGRVHRLTATPDTEVADQLRESLAGLVAKDWIGQALEDDGWNSQGPGPEFGWCRGDFCLVLRAWDERTAEGLPSTTPAPRGWETIEIDTRAWS